MTTPGDSTARKEAGEKRTRNYHAFLPYCLAISSPLVVVVSNPDEIPSWWIIARVLVLVVVMVGLLDLFSRAVWRSSGRELLLNAFVFYVIGWGCFAYSLQSWVAPAVLTCAWNGLFLLFVAVSRARRVSRTLERLTGFALFFVLSLLAVQTTSLGYYQVSQWAASGEGVGQLTVADSVDTQSVKRPDIYYIILDGYGGEDVLRDFYSLDNSPFLDELRSRGFQVIEQSRSNYNQTHLCVSSTLNMMYLNDLGLANLQPPQPSVDLICNNRVTGLLKQFGYTTIGVENIYYRGAPIGSAFDRYFPCVGSFELTEFEDVWAQTLVFGSGLQSPSYARLRRQVEFQFKKLSEISRFPDSPKFSFVHIVSPHPPFIFDSQGNPVTPSRSFSVSDGNHWYAATPGGTREDYVHGYREQLLYLNKRTLEAIDTILAESSDPPIIVLQGDHGPGSMLSHDSLEDTNLRERFSILNAIHVPADSGLEFYPGMTPVNTFRLLFDHYFETELGPLEDREYFAKHRDPYRFTEVTEQVSAP